MSYIIRLYKTVSILSAKIIMIMGLFVGWGLVFEGNACAQGQPLLYTVPFKAGDSGYLIFRIPAIWAAPNKPLMAFAEGRVSKRKAMGNIDIVLRRSLIWGRHGNRYKWLRISGTISAEIPALYKTRRIVDFG